MILGIVSLATCLWITIVMPILAIVFGHIGLSQTKQQGTPGRGMAITGLVTGYISLALFVLYILLIIFFGLSSPTPTF